MTRLITSEQAWTGEAKNMFGCAQGFNCTLPEWSVAATGSPVVDAMLSQEAATVSK